MSQQAPGRRERGAVAVITAIIVMFVAVGMLALSVDLGRITYDRAKLQNGADAAALAIAADCAGQAASGCSSTPSSQIQQLVNANASASDGAQDLTDAGRPTGKPPICFGNYTVAPTCPIGSLTDLSDCLPVPAWVTTAHSPYVEVRTRTKTSSGTILPAVFGPSPGTTHITCSRAAWGAAGNTGATLPVAMSFCDWSAATGNGANYAPPPAYNPAPGPVGTPASLPASVSPYVRAVFLHNQGAQTCVASPGQTYPGGFGFLTDAGSCTATVSSSSTIVGDPGASIPAGCKDLLKTYLGKTVAIPIYSNFDGSGSNGIYTITGISMFYLAGYQKMSSAQPNSTSVYAQPSTLCPSCNGSTSYLWGWFTTGLLPVTSTTGTPGTNFGASQIYPAG